MSLVSRIGAHLARPLVTAIEEKEKGTVQFVGLFKCTHYRDGKDWKPVAGDEQITAYLNLVKTDGTLNEITIRNLKDALGWNGESFATLQRDDWQSGPQPVECQVVVGEEEYQGRKQKRVTYLNPKDYTPHGVGAAKTDVIQSLDARYGAMLRSLGGKSNGARLAAVQAPATNGQMGKDLAWSAFNTRVNAYGQEHPEDAYTKERRIEVFRTIVTDIAKDSGKEVKALSPADWAKIKTEIERNLDPASGSFVPF